MVKPIGDRPGDHSCKSGLPPWAVVHIPHDSTFIPSNIRNQFVLSDQELSEELIKITDHHTLELFAENIPARQVIKSPISRLVVDMERFECDEEEPMAARGMGVIYMNTCDGQPLRHDLSDEARTSLLADWYRPHHQALTTAVDLALEMFDRAIVIDGHSFPLNALPYEMDQSGNRPEICIGADSFHTPKALVDSLIAQFEQAGLTTAVNAPFAGALVPLKHYQKDSRVQAVMIEVRRDLYLDESTGDRSMNFSEIAKIIRHCLASGVDGSNTQSF